METTSGGEAGIGTTRSRSTWVVGLRILTGVIGLVALAAKYQSAQEDMDLAVEAEASAVQAIQLYSVHIFDAIVIVGAVIALYVVSRAFAD